MPNRQPPRVPPEPLLERRGERRALADAARAARHGEGRVVIVEGSAGIGKTALLEALAAGLDAGTVIANGRGSELEEEFAFGVALQLLTPLVEATRPSCFAGAARLAAPLFERAEVETGRDAIFPVLHGLHWLCANLAEGAPLVLCVDDAQWADVPSLRFLSYLGARASDLPLLIAVARRTGEPSGAERELDQLAAGASTVRLRPAELSREAVAELARRELAGRASDRLGERCWRLSGGNPLFARELLRGGEIGEAGDVAGTPESISNLIRRRLRRTGETAGCLAKAVAVLGDACTPAELQAVAELDTEATLAGLDELAAAELTDRRAPHRFRHPIMRQAVAESIPGGERSLLHMRAARVIAPRDAERAASHLVAARPRGPSGEPWAAQLLRDAAAAARRLGGTAAAIAYLRRCLEEPIGAADRRDTLLELGRLEALAGEAAALEHLAEAAALAVDPAQRARIALVRGDALFYAARLEECSLVCREAIEQLGDADRELRLALEASALNADGLRGVNRKRPGELAAEVQAGVTAGERAVLVHVVADLGATGDRDAAAVQELGRRALSSGRLLDEVGPSSPLFVYAGTALTWAGDEAAAFELTNAALRLARERGSPVGVAYSAALRSGIALRRGDLRLAEADAELVVAEMPGADPIAYASALAWLIEALVERGRVEEARERLDRSGLGGELPELGTIAFLLLARASLARAEGDGARAVAELEEVGRRAGRAHYPNPAAIDWRSRCAVLLAGAGERRRARALLDEEVELARRFGAALSLGLALARRGAVRGGAGGLADLRAAVEILAPGNPVEHARAILGEGRAMHAGGERGARETLYRGMDLAHRAGAQALVEEAMAALRETGARPRRPRVTGVDALTPQERRVAQLAAEGRGNREIAEALFLTRRTVEMHLSHAYRKLHIDSRQQLPAALERG